MHLTKYGILCRLQHNIKNRIYIWVQNNFGVELLLFTKQCHAQNVEDACDRAYSVNVLNDSELLDLGSAFKSLPITRYLRIGKNNMLSIFMLSGSIPFSNSISV